MSVMAMAAQPVAHGGPFTRADLDQLPDDGRRYEIVDGVLIMSASSGRLHQRAVGRLYRQLDTAGQYREVAAVGGDEAFAATVPFPVTVVPAELVR